MQENIKEWEGIEMIIRDASGEWGASPKDAVEAGADAYYLLTGTNKTPLPIAILENTEEGNMTREWFKEFLNNGGVVQANNFFNEKFIPTQKASEYIASELEDNINHKNELIYRLQSTYEEQLKEHHVYPREKPKPDAMAIAKILLNDYKNNNRKQ